MSLSSRFIQYFEEVDDPRINIHKVRHELMDIIVITILAVICGADNWVDISEFGESKYDWLQKFLKLPNGIPSHDTFGRLFSLIDSHQLQECFINWVNSLVTLRDGEIVAIDGKRLRRSHDEKNNKHSAIHMVSAWASENRMVLGQLNAENKSEITCIPKLLDILDIANSVITIDAIGCQKKIVSKIVEKGADYVIAVKKNQGKLHKRISETFDKAEELEYRAMVYDECSSIDDKHAKLDKREYTVLPLMYLFEFRKEWEKLQCFVRVRTTGISENGNVEQVRYFISSLKPKAKMLENAIKQHWQIENQLHWCLDVSFSEDYSRARLKNSAENLSVIRRIAINLLKNEKKTKIGIAAKRKKAGWDNKYLSSILELIQN